MTVSRRLKVVACSCIVEFEAVNVQNIRYSISEQGRVCQVYKVAYFLVSLYIGDWPLTIGMCVRVINRFLMMASSSLGSTMVRSCMYVGRQAFADLASSARWRKGSSRWENTFDPQLLRSFRCRFVSEHQQRAAICSASRVDDRTVDSVYRGL